MVTYETAYFCIMFFCPGPLHSFHQPKLLHELQVVHNILFMCYFSLFHFYKGYTTHIYLISGGRDSKEISGVSALEALVTTVKVINYCTGNGSLLLHMP